LLIITDSPTNMEGFDNTAIYCANLAGVDVSLNDKNKDDAVSRKLCFKKFILDFNNNNFFFNYRQEVTFYYIFS